MTTLIVCECGAMVCRDYNHFIAEGHDPIRTMTFDCSMFSPVFFAAIRQHSRVLVEDHRTLRHVAAWKRASIPYVCAEDNGTFYRGIMNMLWMSGLAWAAIIAGIMLWRLR